MKKILAFIILPLFILIVALLCGMSLIIQENIIEVKKSKSEIKELLTDSQLFYEAKDEYHGRCIKKQFHDFFRERLFFRKTKQPIYTYHLNDPGAYYIDELLKNDDLPDLKEIILENLNSASNVLRQNAFFLLLKIDPKDDLNQNFYLEIYKKAKSKDIKMKAFNNIKDIELRKHEIMKLLPESEKRASMLLDAACLGTFPLNDLDPTFIDYFIVNYDKSSILFQIALCHTKNYNLLSKYANDKQNIGWHNAYIRLRELGMYKRFKADQKKKREEAKLQNNQ